MQQTSTQDLFSLHLTFDRTVVIKKHNWQLVRLSPAGTRKQHLITKNCVFPLATLMFSEKPAPFGFICFFKFVIMNLLCDSHILLWCSGPERALLKRKQDWGRTQDGIMQTSVPLNSFLMKLGCLQGPVTFITVLGCVVFTRQHFEDYVIINLFK